jgi:NADH-quinone oxidoreductase subunit E
MCSPGASSKPTSQIASLGVFHFDQIAAWTPDHVAWVDHYLRLRGRIAAEEWVEQADDLARDGPEAARRISEDETL